MKSLTRILFLLFLTSVISVGCGGGDDQAAESEDPGAVEVEGGGEPELAEEGP